MGSGRCWGLRSPSAWSGSSRASSWGLSLSTLALEGSNAAVSGGDEGSRLLLALRYADLVVLALALPLFLLIGASMIGYAAAAGAWILQRLIQFAAERGAKKQLAAGVRRNALAMLAAATLARLWLVTLAILLVGLLGNREAGLAAALLSLVLVTVSLGSRGFIHLLTQEEGR
jgi:hypothetical protein